MEDTVTKGICMKICEHCGAQQEDRRTTFIDCGETLGAPIDSREAERLYGETAAAVDRLERQSDPLRVTLSDRIAALYGGLAAVTALVLSGLWADRGLTGLFLASALFSALGACFLLFPRILWGLERIRLSFLIDSAETAEPSAWYRMMRRIGAYSLLAAGTACLILPLFGVS